MLGTAIEEKPTDYAEVSVVKEETQERSCAEANTTSLADSAGTTPDVHLEKKTNVQAPVDSGEAQTSSTEREPGIGSQPVKDGKTNAVKAPTTTTVVASKPGAPQTHVKQSREALVSKKSEENTSSCIVEDVSKKDPVSKPAVTEPAHPPIIDEPNVQPSVSQESEVKTSAGIVHSTSPEAADATIAPFQSEPSVSTETSSVNSETVSSSPVYQKLKFSKFKSTYEVMKSMDFSQPKEIYQEPDVVIVNFDKLQFFSSRLKEIQKSSDVTLITSKMVFVPYNATDQFIMKKGLLCKRKDLQKSDVFIVLLKSTAVYREIVSALTEQYPDLEFNEFMSLIDSSFAYITPAEIQSSVESIEKKLSYVKYLNFIEMCKIVNYDIVGNMLDQLRTMQKADNAIQHRYSRLLANGGLDDAYIIKHDLVCQFVGTMDFKVWLPKSPPDQIAIMYIVHEAKHDLNLVKFLELLRETFDGVNPALIYNAVALCSICHPPALANMTSIAKACEQKCPALKSLPPEIIYKIRQIQFASSVYKAQIDLLTKGQSKPGSRYILDTSLLCKAMSKGNEQVYRVVVSPSSLKEVVTLLHTTYHRKTLDEFVSFVNEFLAVTKDVCYAAFRECYMCSKSKTKMPVDVSLKPQSKPADLPKPQSKTAESPKLQSKRVEETGLSEEPQSKSSKGEKDNATEADKGSSRISKDKSAAAEDQPKTSDKQKASASSHTQATTDEPELSKPSWESKEKAALPPKTARGEALRRAIMKDLRNNDRIWGAELVDRVKYIVRLLPDRILSEVILRQRSCPELLGAIKGLEGTKPVRNAKEMLCGGILFVLKSRTKPKIAVKQIKHINYLLITDIHKEIHDWSINKVHATIGIVFDISPSKEEVEETMNWFCHRCMKPEARRDIKLYSSLDEKLDDFYKKFEWSKGTIKEKEEVSKKAEKRLPEGDIYAKILNELPILEKIWEGKELSDKIKHVAEPIPETALKAVITAQRECSETMEIIETLEDLKPLKDARHVICGGVLFVVRSKKKQMMVKIHVKPIKNINYTLITKMHAACHDWSVNRLQTTIGISFDVSPTREEVAVTVDWFCSQCQKPDTTSKKKKTAASLEDQLKELYSTIDPALLKSKDETEDPKCSFEFTQEESTNTVRNALAKLPSPVVSKIQMAQMQSPVLSTQIKLLENMDGPVKEKGHCLVMSLLCRLVEVDGKAAWRVMVPSDVLKELVHELHNVYYHDMIQEDFSEFVNVFMNVPPEMINEIFSSCAVCLTTVRRVPTLSERGIKEDSLRKTMASISEMIEFIMKWQTECPAIVRFREGVKRCRADAIAEHFLYKDVLFKVCWSKAGKSKGPRPKIAVALLPNALDEVIKATHAFYHSNNPNQLFNLITTTFDVAVPKDVFFAKIPELCTICRKKAQAQKSGDGNAAGVEGNANHERVVKEEQKSDLPAGTSGAIVKEELDLPVDVKTEEPTPLGVLLLGRLCDQVIEESSNSSRALDSPVPELPTSEESPPPVVQRNCKILLQRCPYDPEIVQEIPGKVQPKRKKTTLAKTPAKRGKKIKSIVPEDTKDSDDSASQSSAGKRKFVVYSSDEDTDDSVPKKPKQAKKAK